MTTTPHTPAPWKTMNWGRTISINGDNGNYLNIAVVNAGGDHDNGIPAEIDRANARLIAAAPELLEALRDMTLRAENMASMLNSFGYPGYYLATKPQVDTARRLIAHIEGE